MPEPLAARIVRILTRLREEGLGLLAAFGRSRVGGWTSILLLAAAVTAITTMSFQQLPSSAHVGQIASHDIKAKRNYEIVDEEASGAVRDEAMASVLPVFDVDLGLADVVASRVRDAFQTERTLLERLLEQERGKTHARPQEGGTALSPEAREELRAELNERLGVALSDEELEGFIAEHFSVRAEGALVGILRRILSQPVRAERPTGELIGGKGAVIRRIRGTQGEAPPSSEEMTIGDLAALVTLPEAQKGLESASELRGFRDPEVQDALRSLAARLVVPNCTLNLSETTRRRESAAANTKNVILKINAGEMIVREGERFEPWHVKVLAGIRRERLQGAASLEFLGTLLLVCLTIVVPFRLIEKGFRRAKVARTDYVLMALLGIAALILERLTMTLAPAVREQLFFTVDTTALHYAAPVAGAAMVLRMFLGAEISFAYAIIMSVLAGLFIETDVRYLIFSLASSVAGVIAIAGADRRSLIMRAGSVTGLVGAAAVVGIAFIAGATQGSVSWSLAAGSAFFAFLGGIGSGVFATIAAPLIESVSGYTSDIKLLELANLNHPLLRDLVVRAPGTYHHSHVVGLLGEAAAQAISANALLVRVGAYYHDVGKLKKPLYFIENVKSGENRHERLTPHMSALIVAAHVKEGVELAVAAKVPKVIVDMIPQHHGTRRISFFYDKAKSQEDPEVMKVDPKDFSYPGPKPQSREAAILMLADVAEASVRALKEKSPARIEQTVRKVIHDIFNESQLDECDLTLRDLNEIGQAFERTLMGIYHLRIEYTKDMEHDRSEVHPEEGDPAGAHPDAKRARHDASELV